MTFLIGYLVCLIIYLTIDILTCIHNELASQKIHNELVFVKLFNIIGIHFFFHIKADFTHEIFIYVREMCNLPVY